MSTLPASSLDAGVEYRADVEKIKSPVKVMVGDRIRGSFTLTPRVNVGKKVLLTVSVPGSVPSLWAHIYQKGQPAMIKGPSTYVASIYLKDGKGGGTITILPQLGMGLPGPVWLCSNLDKTDQWSNWVAVLASKIK